MLNPSRRLREFEVKYGRVAYAGMSYAEALELFTGLWMEARALGADLGADWEADLAPAIAVARAVNGLPPRA